MWARWELLLGVLVGRWNGMKWEEQRVSFAMGSQGKGKRSSYLFSGVWHSKRGSFMALQCWWRWKCLSCG